ncbi:MAG: class II aldolase/adducin family protein [Candidatus Omnitrophica bacterium]|jgi:hypothetical protein|nr:class II aldolase/adducin family protein [Candidatus Omnitrophota bacterium]
MILLVTGDFNNIGKSSYFGECIYNELKNQYRDIDFYNGGQLYILDQIINNISKYKTIIWMPNIDNSIDKYLPKIKVLNKKCLLVTSKRNDNDKYSTFEIIERMFKNHSNLCIVINKQKEYNFKILDTLGNIWINTDTISGMSLMLIKLINYISNLSRVESVNVNFNSNINIEPKFLDIIHSYGDIFKTKINGVINKERFLGNISTRCMFGFPSYKLNDMIFVSQRNINKETLDSTGFVPVQLLEDKVFFSGFNKPSVDTAVQIRLYNYYKNVNYIIHGHIYTDSGYITDKYIPCGYVEEFNEIINIIPDNNASNFSVNLIGHGCLILSKNLDYFNSIKFISRNFPEYMTLSTIR